MIGLFGKKMSNIPVDNESSLDIPITIKIIALTNITLIETFVLLLYLLLYYLIFNLPLLCTSSWRFENLPGIPIQPNRIFPK
jgi:hypothetical protein